MDLVHLQPLLDQLIPLLRESDFDEISKQLTKNLDLNSKTQVKNELNRLNRSCKQIIDMRSTFKNSCQRYDFKGITHFMPVDAIALFQSQLYLYNDNYTTGVYEALQQWQQHQNGEQLTPNLRLFDVNAIPFAHYFGNNQERMLFSSPITIILQDGGKLLAKCSDLSVSGMRISVPYLPEYQKGDRITILFTGLIENYPKSRLYDPVDYQIVGEESKNSKHWLRVVRYGPMTYFDQFIKQFIESNKSRFRVSVDNQLSAAVVKGYEQFYLPRMTGIALFFNKTAPYTLELALRTENNQHILEYWRNEKNQDILSSLFMSQRMSSLCPSSSETSETIIYSFSHVTQSQIYFFSATKEELAQRGLTALFFKIGSQRSSWRVFKFIIESCHPIEEADIGLSTEQQTVLQEASLRPILERIGYIGLLQELNNDHYQDESNHIAQQHQDANLLQCFIHETNTTPFRIETLHYAQLRKELRYAHKTQVMVYQQGKEWVGWSRDISTRGLQIELEIPFNGDKSELIAIGLPQLQSLTTSMNLRYIPYRIVTINVARTILHLVIDGHAEKHIGFNFFTQLIESNRQKLATTAEPRQYRGLAQALRNIYTQHLFNTPIYISKINGGFKANYIGISTRKYALSPLLQACSQPLNKQNLYPILQGKLFNTLLVRPLQNMNRDTRPTEQEIYIAWHHANLGSPIIHSKLERDFASIEEKHLFIEAALQHGHFYSVSVGISRAGKPDTQFIANEISYITKFAMHKATKLEEELWSVVGIAELTDTTQATLFKLGLSLASTQRSDIPIKLAK